MANLGWVRQNFNANLDNLRLLHEQVARDEILLLLADVVPRLRLKGLDDAGLRQLLIDNPARAFAFS